MMVFVHAHLRYRIRAIITQSLYLNPLFEDKKRFLRSFFSLNSGLIYVYYSRAVSKQERVIMAQVQYIEIDFCSYLFLVFNTYSGQPQSL